MLNGYTLGERIYQGPGSLVHRGRRISDDRPVILKMCARDVPSSRVVSRFHHEFEIGRLFEGEENVLQYLTLEERNGAPAMVGEDFGGCSLKSLIPEMGFDPLRFFDYALPIVSGLVAIHAKGVIHKDIKPHNIIVNPQTGQVKFIGFGYATRMRQERAPGCGAEEDQGTLAYMSPEQTGRMNRDVDSRTDLYSVGVLFHELLTGLLPIRATDPLEILHQKIAHCPRPLTEFRPGVPAILSQIVVKLLATEADDRYQSAAGLHLDLLRCRALLAEAAGDNAQFIIGEFDIPDQFRVSQNLHGREEQLALLIRAYESVCGVAGRSRLLLVSGYSGVGKTSLIREIHKPLSQGHGYFISGKFDPFKRNVPYAPLIAAFGQLVSMVLAESEDRIARWRVAILEALGPNGQVMVDVLPELKFLIGPQPAVAQLAPPETRNRFLRVLQAFCGVFGNETRSLVIFLDDLQWADAPTLECLDDVLGKSSTHGLLVLAAYRDNEVPEGHRLTQLIRDLRARDCVEEIALKPLDREQVGQLLADSFRRSAAELEPLSHVVFEKTQGNPFFISQFLATMEEEDLIHVDPSKGGWVGDAEGAKRLCMTENVVDLMVARFRRLPAQTIEILAHGACVGNVFDLGLVARVLNKSVSEALDAAMPAIRLGVLVPLDDRNLWAQHCGTDNRTILLRFLHDRVQQAADTLISADDSPRVHLALGRLLKESTETSQREGAIFDIANHLNLAAHLITDADEFRSVIEINLAAARLAKRSSAYAPALNYASRSVAYLTDNSWTSDYQLALDAFSEKGEIEYLNASWDDAIETLDHALQHAETTLDRCRISESKAILYRMKNDLGMALETAVGALRELGVHISAFPSADEEAQELARIAPLLEKHDTDSILGLAEMEDPKKLAIMRLLRECFAPANFLASRLTTVIGVRMTELSLLYGRSPTSATGFIFHSSMGLASRLRDYDHAYELGKAAIELNDSIYHDRSSEALILDMWGTFVSNHKVPLAQSRNDLLRGYRSGAETGSYQWAGYCATNRLFMTFWGPHRLEELEGDIRAILPDLSRIDPNMAQFYYAIRAASHNLRRPAKRRTVLDAEQWPEVEPFLETSQAQDDHVSLLVHNLCRLTLANIYGDREQALRLAWEGGRYADGSPGVFINPVFKFHQSLAFLTVMETMESVERKQARAIVDANLELIEIWGRHCPTTYSHQAFLIRAEVARVDGRADGAGAAYEAAIDSAQQSGFDQDVGLAAERAHVFYLSTGRKRAARSYLQEALSAYHRWGAAEKVRALNVEYRSELELAGAVDRQIPTKDVLPTADFNSSPLDLLSVARASQALSSEIDLGTLLPKLLGIIVEAAGAQRGYLLLARHGRLTLEAGFEPGDASAKSVPSWVLNDQMNVAADVVRYVFRTGRDVVLADASAEHRFARDRHISNNLPRSVLCAALRRQGEAIGIVYLENNLVGGAFSDNRLQMVNVLLAQAAVSLENAKLYSERRRAEARLEAAQAIAKLGSWNWDLETRTVDFSKELYHILGLNPFTDLASFARYRKSMLAGDRLLARAALKRTILADEPYLMEHRFIRPDGGEIVAEVRIEVERNSLGRPLRITGTLQDVTSRSERERGLRLASRVFDAVADGIVITNCDGRIVDVNPAFSRITGYAKDEAVGEPASLTKSGYHEKEFYEDMWGEILCNGFWQGEVWDRRKNGELFVKSLTINAVYNGAGEASHCVGVFNDINRQKESEEGLKHLAYYDSLTGIPNRVLFRDRVEQQLAIGRRDGKCFAILFLDLDQFKDINDTLGHENGDELLVEYARRIRSCVRESDTLARLGGDEFMILLPGLDGRERAEIVAQKLLKVTREPFNLGGRRSYVSASIGIAVCPDDGSTFDELTRNADAAMYQAKEEGRNRLRLYDPTLTTRIQTRLTMEQRLHRALEREEFELFYQPKIDMRSQAVVGVEALLRWIDPERGVISPADFIPIAEDTGLIEPIGDWVIDTAARYIKRFAECGFSELCVAVNLSVRQFRNRQLLERIVDAVKRAEIDGTRLEFEITESLVMTNRSESVAMMRKFRELGFRIALDDFGTGYSSLSHLKELPIDTLKVDRSFVKHMHSDPRDAALVTAIVQMGKALKLTIVAEGVERLDQLAFLETLDCDQVQGFIHSPPRPFADCMEFLVARRDGAGVEQEIERQ